MRKINKISNISLIFMPGGAFFVKLISLILICAFLLTNTAYGIDLSRKSNLRKPLDFNRNNANGDERYHGVLLEVAANPDNNPAVAPAAKAESAFSGVEKKESLPFVTEKEKEAARVFLKNYPGLIAFRDKLEEFISLIHVDNFQLSFADSPQAALLVLRKIFNNWDKFHTLVTYISADKFGVVFANNPWQVVYALGKIFDNWSNFQALATYTTADKFGTAFAADPWAVTVALNTIFNNWDNANLREFITYTTADKFGTAFAANPQAVAYALFKISKTWDNANLREFITYTTADKFGTAFAADPWAVTEALNTIFNNWDSLKLREVVTYTTADKFGAAFVANPRAVAETLYTLFDNWDNAKLRKFVTYNNEDSSIKEASSGRVPSPPAANLAAEPIKSPINITFDQSYMDEVAKIEDEVGYWREHFLRDALKDENFVRGTIIKLGLALKDTHIVDVKIKKFSKIPGKRIYLITLKAREGLSIKFIIYHAHKFRVDGYKRGEDEMQKDQSLKIFPKVGIEKDIDLKFSWLSVEYIKPFTAEEEKRFSPSQKSIALIIAVFKMLNKGLYLSDDLFGNEQYSFTLDENGEIEAIIHDLDSLVTAQSTNIINEVAETFKYVNEHMVDIESKDRIVAVLKIGRGYIKPTNLIDGYASFIENYPDLCFSSITQIKEILKQLKADPAAHPVRNPGEDPNISNGAVSRPSSSPAIGEGPVAKTESASSVVTGVASPMRYEDLLKILPEIELFAFDLGGTLVEEESGDTPSEEIIAGLAALLNKGKRVVFISAKLDKSFKPWIEEKLLPLVDADKRGFLMVYGDRVTKKYQGNRYGELTLVSAIVFPYPDRMQTMAEVAKIAAAKINKKALEDPEIAENVRISLRDNPIKVDIYDTYIQLISEKDIPKAGDDLRVELKESVESELRKVGLLLQNITVDHQGKKGVIILSNQANKPGAILDLRQELGVEANKIVYVADQFGGKITADLPVAYTGIYCLNIGDEQAKKSNVSNFAGGMNASLEFIKATVAGSPDAAFSRMRDMLMQENGALSSSI